MRFKTISASFYCIGQKRFNTRVCLERSFATVLAASMLLRDAALRQLRLSADAPDGAWPERGSGGCAGCEDASGVPVVRAHADAECGWHDSSRSVDVGSSGAAFDDSGGFGGCDDGERLPAFAQPAPSCSGGCAPE